MLKHLVREKTVEVEWPAYVNACRQIAEHPAERTEQALNRKRAHAMNYLGNKARRFGDVYSKVEPRVFTLQFVSELGRANAARRASRNPWLEAMLQAASNDDVNRTFAKNGNVLSFGPHIAPHGDSVHLSS